MSSIYWKVQNIWHMHTKFNLARFTFVKQKKYREKLCSRQDHETTGQWVLMAGSRWTPNDVNSWMVKKKITILPGFFPGNLLEKEEKVIIQYDILFEYVNQ